MEDIDFWVDFVAENSNKLQKMGLKGKIHWASTQKKEDLKLKRKKKEKTRFYLKFQNVAKNIKGC